MKRASWIVVAATFVLSTFAGAEEWPQFRGPNSSGIGDGKPPVEFGPSQNVLWKTAVGAGLSSPIIAKGRVFLTEFDRATKQLATLCIDQRTGKILWRRTVAPARDRKSSRNQQSRSAHARHRRRARLCLLRVLWVAELRLRWKAAVGAAAPSPAEPLTARSPHRLSPATCWCLTIKGKTLTCWRQSPRRQDRLEDGPLAVSVWMVDARVLAARRDR